MNHSLSTAAPLETIEITWGQRSTVAELRRTQRRVLRIEVCPSGNVVVFAPLGEERSRIEERVKRKRPWIFRKLDRVLSWPLRTPERHFVSGETHLLLGKQYRLSVEQSDKPDVRIEGTRLKVFTRRADDQMNCRRLVTKFYSALAHSVFNERLHAVAPPFIRRGLDMPALVVRQMSKRWGSYTSAGRIVLNVDLVRANPMLIDYVICHELAHGFYSGHGKEWRSLLSTIMPDWEARKTRLEALLR
jgi:predicted metal-dependent hydrolase